MPTELLSIGRPIPIIQDIPYALPARRVSIYTNDVAATLVQSNDPAMVVTTPVTLVEGQFTVSGAFIKSTGGNITVTLKAD